MAEVINLDKTDNWDEYVKSEVMSLLNSILPSSEKGAIGVQYKNLVVGESESGEQIFDNSKAIGIDIILSFDFGKEIDKPM
jgi:hypothetical protein